MQPSTIKKFSVVIGGHKTSVSLEQAFWTELRRIAKARRLTMAALVGAVDARRHTRNLSSKLRLEVLDDLTAERAAPAAAKREAA